MKKVVAHAVFTLVVLALVSVSAMAQPAVLVGGLKAPTRMTVTPGGNLLVAESGTGQMDGRISLIDRSGNRRTLVDGLPSGMNVSGGEPAPSGPTAVAMIKRTLYVVIGAGDATMAGPVAGTAIPNPQVSSPFFSSVLALRFDTAIDNVSGSFTFTTADYTTLTDAPKLTINSGDGHQLVASVTVNFPPFTNDPRPDLPNNVRDVNPFGIDIRGNSLFVADASQNQLYEIDLDGKGIKIVAAFDPLPNPLPFGPPVMEAVPNNVRVFGKRFLVTCLTGFPFAQGSAEVAVLKLANGKQATFIGGLTSAIDVLPVKGPQGQDQFYTLEFSTDMLSNAPGRLQFYSSATAAPVVVAGGLITPISLARDPQDGSIYVTSIFTGTILKVPGAQ